jgi:hypothetical protein
VTNKSKKIYLSRSPKALILTLKRNVSTFTKTNGNIIESNKKNSQPITADKTLDLGKFTQNGDEEAIYTLNCNV